MYLSINLKEGSANVWSLLNTIIPNGTFIINLNPTATFSRYVCAMQPGSEAHPLVIFDSNDCAEYEEVDIVYEEHSPEGPENSKRITWKGTVKRREGFWKRLGHAFKSKGESDNQITGQLPMDGAHRPHGITRRPTCAWSVSAYQHPPGGAHAFGRREVRPVARLVGYQKTTQLCLPVGACQAPWRGPLGGGIPVLAKVLLL